jgi:hypothetical protein
MVSPQHSMGDGYARRKCDNCWDGKSTRDVDEGVLLTLCTVCETRKGPFVSVQIVENSLYTDDSSRLIGLGITKNNHRFYLIGAYAPCVVASIASRRTNASFFA